MLFHVTLFKITSQKCTVLAANEILYHSSVIIKKQLKENEVMKIENFSFETEILFKRQKICKVSMEYP